MICTTRDQFVENYMEQNPCWIVELASGLAVFQDDYRPGVAPHSAWERLHTYCMNTGDYIEHMRIKFRTNIHRLPSHADGYYFSKGARGGFAFPTMHLFFIGTLNQDVLEVTCWKVPEMMKEETEVRNPEQAGICLIRKNMNPNLELKG